MLLRIAFVTLAAAVSIEARADNLLTNPDFRVDAAGWTIQITGNASATVATVDGSPDAGSLELSVTGSDPFDPGSVTVNQCIPSFGPGPWVFGGRLRQVSSTGPFTQGLSVDFLAAPNCGVGLTRSTYADPGATVPGVQGDYVQYSGSVPTDPLPGGGPTRSVLISYQLFSSFGTTTVFRLDKVYFGPPGTTPVELIHYDVQ
ncbi:hypothetical protein [Tahibacter harae]|uniref:Uncharacterized protein n=1 Tax=Tahibacter harae TaxID=2963937 RepID=A0ABT1QVS3_9GAMM|nr:hypothetical protein [Tahibacter harae]MCQ4166384.1 hypothetical protein [Tahibacter harae]